jgi:hypothetical protein
LPLKFGQKKMGNLQGPAQVKTQCLYYTDMG